MEKLSKISLSAISLVALTELFKYVKVSYILGSSFGFFSFNNIFSSMVGVLGSSGLGVSFYALKAMFKLAYLGSNPLLILALQLPLACSALAWNNRLFMMLSSILAMILFVIHPIGNIAYVYALLWFIPLAISLFNVNNIFLTALGSTFIAHAVGSVSWLYLASRATDYAFWISLMPIAFIERVIFAIGMVLSYKLYYYSLTLFKYYKNRLLQASTI